MNYLYEAITPTVTPTTAQTNKYAINKVIMIKSLNKTSIAQTRGCK